MTSKTPAEIVRGRADAAQPEMGLTSWKGERVAAGDVTVAKNFLAPGEVRELNRLTDILLTIFEDQLDIGRLTTMAEAEALLDAQLKGLGRVVLTHGGSVSKDDADRHARQAYKVFAAERKAREKARVDAEYAALRRTAADLPSPRRRRSDA